MNYQTILSFEGGGSFNTFAADRLFLNHSNGQNLRTGSINTSALTFTSVTNRRAASSQEPAYLFGNNDSTLNMFASFAISDSTNLSCGGPIMVPHRSTTAMTELFGFAGAGSDRITVGLNGEFFAIYVNGVIAETSTFNAVWPRKISYVELIVSKETSTVRLIVNSDQVAQTTVGAVTFTSFRMYLPGPNFENSNVTSLNNLPFEHFYIASGTNSVPGPMAIHGHYQTANPTSQFTGSGGIVNSRPFVNATFRNSTTAGQQDLYTYSQINVNEDANVSIKFVRHQVIASSDGAGGGQLNLRTRVNSVNYDTSVSASLVSTTPVIVSATYRQNPNTNNPWTITEAASLSNGYVIAP